MIESSRNFIGVYDGITELTYCQRMIDEFKSIDALSSTYNGQDDNGGLVNRKDVAAYFNIVSKMLAAETHTILDIALERYIEEYPSLGMNSFRSTVVKVQRTGPRGGFHQWHAEHGKDEESSRLLVWMIYLNDTPDGEGTTEFLEQGVRLQPKAGRVVLFPASWTHTHRGNPVYTQEKYIATGWYCHA